MSLRVFLGLLVITMLASIGALVVVLERPVTGPLRTVDEPAFPTLRENPDAVAKVVLTGPDGTLTLVRETGKRWSALERYGYPVDADKLRALIVALADMRLVETKTSMPERYARLEVEDPEQADAKSRLLRVESADGQVLAEVILGKRQHRLTGNQQAGTYLRRPGEAQSWLASGGVDLDTAIIDWLDEEVVDLDPARIGRIEIRPDAGPGYIARRDEPGAPLQLADLAEGEQANDEADLSRLAGALGKLSLEEVKPRAELAWPAIEHTAIATSFDGVELTVRLAKVDDEPWAMLDARAVEPLAAPPAEPASDGPAGAADAGEQVEEVTIADDESPPPEPLSAEDLAARLQPWAFKISTTVFDRLTAPRSDWVEDSGTS